LSEAQGEDSVKGKYPVITVEEYRAMKTGKPAGYNDVGEAMAEDIRISDDPETPDDIMGLLENIQLRLKATAKNFELIHEKLSDVQASVPISGFVSGFFTCLIFVVASLTFLTFYGYSEADREGRCLNEGRNRAVRFVENTGAYKFGCHLGERR
jgi:hypothetical protein